MRRKASLVSRRESLVRGVAGESCTLYTCLGHCLWQKAMRGEVGVGLDVDNCGSDVLLSAWKSRLSLSRSCMLGPGCAAEVLHFRFELCLRDEESSTIGLPHCSFCFPES